MVASVQAIVKPASSILDCYNHLTFEGAVADLHTVGKGSQRRHLDLDHVDDTGTQSEALIKAFKMRLRRKGHVVKPRLVECVVCKFIAIAVGRQVEA